MTVRFEKYHGNGNDFVIIDDREGLFHASEEIVSHLCDRRFGIGADGLMLVKDSSEADFEMLYFNSDGKPGTMCGNGGRCIAAYAYAKAISSKRMTFNAVDGLHQAVVNSEEIKNTLFDVSLQMQPVIGVMEKENSYFLDTGSPHYVEFVACADSTDVFEKGKQIRYSDDFKPEGTNVNFVQIDEDSLYVRTYERGVEDETLSCGTGVTASAMAAFLETGIEEWRIKTRGGDFKVTFSWDGSRFTDVWLRGPARLVYKGEIEIE